MLRLFWTCGIICVSSCHTLSVWFVCLSPRFADTTHIMCITNTAQNTVEILSHV
jgi:hypothetical protein